MSLPYLAPGVTVTEVVSPSLSTVSLNPNVIAIVGPGQGFINYTDKFVLSDNTPVTLSGLNADVGTIVVQDATNVTLAPFTATTTSANNDYTVNTSLLATTGQISIVRTMQTTIVNGQTVVVYYENSASPSQGTAYTNFLTLNKLIPAAPINLVSGTQSASIRVESEGLAPSGDYTVAGSGGSTPTIVWVNSATVLGKYQTVYIDYEIASVQYKDLAVQLNNLSTVSLPADAASIIVKTAPGVSDSASTAVLYQKGTGTTLDYIVAGSGITTTIARSEGTTTIGGTNDSLVVQVTYQATPSSYWLPTVCYSQNDVENQFGPPWDATGNVLNPVSLASSLAFANGATTVVMQALFTAGTPNVQPAGTVDDWENTLLDLQTVDGIDFIVPIIASGNLVTEVTDSLNLQILTAIQNFIYYMQVQQNQFMMGIFGEDSTNGVLAQDATLQAHGVTIGASTPAQDIVLLEPAAYGFPNPVTGVTTNLGGQYMAAAIAGLAAQYPPQTPLTRKGIAGFASVLLAQTETQKNADAGSGLCVIEQKNGVIRVRHSITTAQDTRAHQEFSVVRVENLLLNELISALDTQAIGQIILTTTASQSLQLLIANQLEQLVDQNAIVSYDAIQVSPSANDPTTLNVRFSYLPAYPLNHIAITFSLDSSAGISAISSSVSST